MVGEVGRSTPMSTMVDQRMPATNYVAQIADQLQDLARPRRAPCAVGDEQGRIQASAWAIIALWRCPSPSWCGYAWTASTEWDLHHRASSMARRRAPLSDVDYG